MEKGKKIIYKKWWFWLLIIFIIFIVIPSFMEGVQDENSILYNYTESNILVEKQDRDVETIINQENRYRTYIEWTNNGNDDYNQYLKIAVEEENYEGDNLEAGTYIFKHTNTVFEGKNERVYNIYISDTDYNNINEVPLTDWKFGIGGVQYNKTEKYILKKGDYIYIQLVPNGEYGHIAIDKE